VQNLTRKPKTGSEMVRNEEQRRPETKPERGAMEQGRFSSLEFFLETREGAREK
jgi:hypothetical protein